MQIKGNIFTYEQDYEGRIIFKNKADFRTFCESIIKNDRKERAKRKRKRAKKSA